MLQSKKNKHHCFNYSIYILIEPEVYQKACDSLLDIDPQMTSSTQIDEIKKTLASLPKEIRIGKIATF